MPQSSDQRCYRIVVITAQHFVGSLVDDLNATCRDFLYVEYLLYWYQIDAHMFGTSKSPHPRKESFNNHNLTRFSELVESRFLHSSYSHS